MAEGGEKPKYAVGFKLSSGMETSEELEEKSKLERQHSKLVRDILGLFSLSRESGYHVRKGIKLFSERAKLTHRKI